MHFEMLPHMAWVTTPREIKWWNVTPWSITEAPTGDMVWLGPIGMIRKAPKAPAQLSRWDDLLRPDDLSDLSALKRSQAQGTWHVCYTNSVRIGRHGRLIHARIQRKSFFLSPSVSGLVAFGLNLEACWSYVQWILPNWLKSGEVCGAELPWNTDAFSNQERTHVPTSKSLKEGANQGSRMIYEVACKVWDGTIMGPTHASTEDLVFQLSCTSALKAVGTQATGSQSFRRFHITASAQN